MLYTLKDIIEKLTEVNKRDIIDIMHRKYVTPVMDTAGCGSHRVYNLQNIYELCICLSLRGRVPSKIDTLSLIKDIISLDAEVVFITYMANKTYVVKAESMPRIRSVDPQSFCFDIIETGALRKHISDVFGGTY